MVAHSRGNGRTVNGTGWAWRRVTGGCTGESGRKATRGATASAKAAQATPNTRAHGPMASKTDTVQKHTPTAVSITRFNVKFLEYQQKYFGLYDREVFIS